MTREQEINRLLHLTYPRRIREFYDRTFEEATDAAEDLAAAALAHHAEFEPYTAAEVVDVAVVFLTEGAML